MTNQELRAQINKLVVGVRDQSEQHGSAPDIYPAIPDSWFVTDQIIALMPQQIDKHETQLLAMFIHHLRLSRWYGNKSTEKGAAENMLWHLRNILTDKDIFAAEPPQGEGDD